MSRPLRIEFAGAFYHVTARGNERKKIFVPQRDYARFKEYLGIARERFERKLQGAKELSREVVRLSRVKG